MPFTPIISPMVIKALISCIDAYERTARINLVYTRITAAYMHIFFHSCDKRSGFKINRRVLNIIHT